MKDFVNSRVSSLPSNIYNFPHAKHKAKNTNLLKGKLSKQMLAKENHSSYPEEQDVMSCFQKSVRVEELHVFCLKEKHYLFNENLLYFQSKH